MASFISDTEKANLTGIFNNIFDTFQRPIIIYKEPIKIAKPSVNTNNFAFGFGNSQAEDEYTYQEVSGVFPATIRYQTLIARSEYREQDNLSIKIPEGGCSIKVRQDARDFINNGRTEKFIVDEKTYYLDSDERSQKFLNSSFWVYILKPTR